MTARLLAPFGVIAVLGLAAALRFWALGRPDELVFDELYYVRDAITQLAHGYPTSWPDDDPTMGAPFSDDPSYAVHPPLGKWLIALGLIVFGDDSGWGWRSAVAFAGVATVAVTMRLGWWIGRSVVVSIFAGLLLAIDGVHVVLSRVALLDGFLTFFIALGALLMWRDHEWTAARGSWCWNAARPARVLWNRPWLFAAAAAFGCAASVKWSGLYPLAAFLLLTAVRDLWLRVARARAVRAGAARRVSSHPWLRGIAQAFATGLIAIPTALVVYVASWTGWIVTSGGWGRDEGPWPAALWKYHLDMFGWHSTLSAPHPFQSHPLSWPLALRPTAMYEEAAGEGFTAAITPIPNLLVTWGGVLALFVLVWWIVRAGRAARIPYAAAFVLVGYLSGWLPWVLTFSRSAVFQFYAVVLTPFSALALALVLGAICGVYAPASPHRRSALARRVADSPPAANPDALLSRRLSVAVFLIVAVVLSLLFFPSWSGIPVPDWYSKSHLWLPGWD